MSQSILITGCSGGIGYETAKFLRQMGWQVFASCRRAEDTARLREEGFEHALVLDIDHSESIAAAFETVLAQTGGTLDALFCNAGYGQPGAVEDIPRQALREQFETNVFGTWECINAAMQIFRRQNRGRIVVNSSILGFAAMPWRGAYNSSKFALEGLCDTLRLELHGSGISVSLVEPGPINTRFRRNALKKFEQHIDRENSVHQESYRRETARLAAEESNAPFGISAASCAAVCVRALTDKKPKARYRITVPTVAFWYLKRILPTAWMDKLQRRAVKAQEQ